MTFCYNGQNGKNCGLDQKIWTDRLIEKFKSMRQPLSILNTDEYCRVMMGGFPLIIPDTPTKKLSA